jgi:hypothetical protein
MVGAVGIGLKAILGLLKRACIAMAEERQPRLGTYVSTTTANETERAFVPPQLPGFITFVGAIHDQPNFPPGQDPVPGAGAGLTTNLRSRAELAHDLQEILRIEKEPVWRAV